MPLFDYDILNGKCSKYETNHLHMYVDDDIDLGNLYNMAISAYATFVNEYILPNVGSVSHEDAEAKALGEYEKFWRIQDKTFFLTSTNS